MPSSSTRSNVSNRNLQVEYATEGSPIKSVKLLNPKGYKNVTITKDTFRKNGSRLKLETGAGEVFIHANVVESLIEALKLIQTYGMDQSRRAA